MTQAAKPITIAGETIHPGERKSVSVTMPALYDWTPVTMPVEVINGKQPGPILCLTAAIHGDEINGVEILRRLLKKPMIKNISGCLIVVPIVNVYGFLVQDRYLPDRRDLNRCFPGSEKGSLASRLCHLLCNDILSNATHLIDLHTGSLHRTNLPQIRANLEHQHSHDLALAFNPPVVMHSNEITGSLRYTTCEKGIPSLIYEAGEALRFGEIDIRIGLAGIMNVMRYLKMLPLPKGKKTKPKVSSVTRSSYWVRAPFSGIMHHSKDLGKRVTHNEAIGIISNPLGDDEHHVYAKHEGIIIGKTNLPLVHEGAALFHIATFDTLENSNIDMMNLDEHHLQQ